MDQFGLYPSGNKVTEKPEILFARLDVKEVVEKAEAMFAERRKAAEPAEEEEGRRTIIDIEPKAEISYDDFAKMQFQVGEILSCEAVPKSKKLLCSQVRDGKPGKADRIRHPCTLHTGGNGRQEGYGSGKS